MDPSTGGTFISFISASKMEIYFLANKIAIYFDFLVYSSLMKARCPLRFRKTRPDLVISLILKEASLRLFHESHIKTTSLLYYIILLVIHVLYYILIILNRIGYYLCQSAYYLGEKLVEHNND